MSGARSVFDVTNGAPSVCPGLSARSSVIERTSSRCAYKMECPVLHFELQLTRLTHIISKRIVKNVLNKEDIVRSIEISYVEVNNFSLKLFVKFI